MARSFFYRHSIFCSIARCIHAYRLKGNSRSLAELFDVLKIALCALPQAMMHMQDANHEINLLFLWRQLLHFLLRLRLHLLLQLQQDLQQAHRIRTA